MTKEMLLKGITDEYTRVNKNFMKDYEEHGYSYARNKWDETMTALENIVEAYDYKLVYNLETKTTTVEPY